MNLIQLLLPLRDNSGNPYPGVMFREVIAHLTAKFGGVTSYMRTPAEGMWEDENKGTIMREDIVVLEVMAKTIDAQWWGSYREELDLLLRQQQTIIRSMAITVF